MQSPSRGRWKYLRKLLENTSGGLDRIVLIRNDEKSRLLLWCSAYILLTGLMVDFSLRSIIAYFAFPTETSIDIAEQNLSVPSIALCSMNPFKRRMLCDKPYEHLCDPSTDFGKAFAQLSSGPANVSDEFVEHYTRAFYNLEDLVVSCWLRGEPCGLSGAEFFTPVVIDAYLYGRCFCMFCERGRKYADALRTRTEFPRHSLVLQLNSTTNDYLSHTEGIGFVFLFYTYRQSPMITRDSVHVAAGETSYMRLETVKKKLLPAPYPSRCGSDWPEEYKYLEGIDEEQYSLPGCMSICLALQVIQECNCWKSEQFSQLSSLHTVCRGSQDEFRCRSAALSSPERFRANCRCHTECSTSSYSVMTSRGGFPASLSKSRSNFTEVSTDPPSDGSDRSPSQNVPGLQVIIYQGTSETTVVEERAKFSFAEMVGAIGSNMNTFTGLSFLVIYETVDVLASWISYISEARL